MSVTYPAVASHPALSAEARSDEDPGRFQAQQEIAEMLLGLAAPAFSRSVDVDKAVHAIALQISFQYAQGMDAHVYSSLSSDRMEGRAFRGSRDGATAVHSVAKMLADQLLSTRDDGQWASGLRSLRGPEC